LKPDESRRFIEHLALLEKQEEHVGELRGFAESCGDDSSSRLLDACKECSATCHKMRQSLAAGELDLGSPTGRFDRFIERADDIRDDIEESIALADRASGLLDELDDAIDAMRRQTEAPGLPPIEPLRLRLSEFEAVAKRLRRRAKRNGYSEKLIVATLEAADTVCSTNVEAIVQATQDSVSRTNELYAPAIAALGASLAPYQRPLNGTASARASQVPEALSLEEYDPFAQFEQADYLRLCSLTLDAKELLGDGQWDDASEKDWDASLRIDQCVETLTQLDAWPDLILERAYLSGVRAVALGWLQSERARSSAEARNALRNFVPIDPLEQSDYLYQLRQALETEMIPRARAQLRALEGQLSGTSSELELAWRLATEDLDSFSERSKGFLTVADGGLMRGLLARVDELERDASIAVSDARRLMDVASAFEGTLVPQLERLRHTQVAADTRGVFEIAELAYGRRVASLTGRVTTLRKQLNDQQRPRTQEDVRRLLESTDSLLARIIELEAEITAMSAVESHWQRCLDGKEFVIESGAVAGTTPQLALKAMEFLYRMRRRDQPVVFVGDTVLFPSPLNERNWDALSGELLAPEPTQETGADEPPVDFEKRISMLLTAWGYVVPHMLWYECRSEDAARKLMRHYVLRGGGKSRTVMQGKVIRLKVRRQRRGAEQGPKGTSGRDQKERPETGPTDQPPAAVSSQNRVLVDIEGQELNVGDKVLHTRLGRCTLFRIVDEDRVWLRFPDGSTHSVLLSETPLRKSRTQD